MCRISLKISGTVQGVGFRPFVYNLANKLGLNGYVNNTAQGVTIELEGTDTEAFLNTIKNDPPPLARIDSVEATELPYLGYKDFRIIESVDSESSTHVSPDVSVCEDCLNDMMSAENSRYLYPFINCTNCGPRYSITEKVPYDRPNTTMSTFRMCAKCEAEYNNPTDRRFHAQPNACAACGPRVSLTGSRQPAIESKDAIIEAIALLKEGKILAIKGLGGFHLACDALNKHAVLRLREKKRKSNKPFALMSANVETIRNFCIISEEEERLLADRRRPIVLLKKLTAERKLSDEIAPNNKYIGFMLPYTPLHYLLFHYPIADSKVMSNLDALVMTSGNLSEEPIVVDNNEALEKLSDIADAFLLHNRDIFMRVDDSVLKMQNNKSSFVRRSRGFVPEPIYLDNNGPEVLACGADLKNTFTLTKNNSAIVSQHIGDMENLDTLNFFEESLKNLNQVYRANPTAIAHDLHPSYLSTKWAIDYGHKSQIPTHGIQHHYAHIASVMAEQGITEKVIGVALDGTGYGTDGSLWGGEFLISGIESFERSAHFKYIPIPGGESAIKECWRTAISYLQHSSPHNARQKLEELGFVQKYGKNNIDNILKLSANRQFSPLSSGAGRLFDAVAALSGVCDKNTFEGEAAIALENLVSDTIEDSYDYDIAAGVPAMVDFSKTIISVVRDVISNIPREVISTKFHNAVATAVKQTVEKISAESGIKVVVLSGGVFQNEYLLKKITSLLEKSGFVIYTNEKVPCNDAGISLGQAYIIRERLKR
ncbi:MAG: carbamoyltransferase HypF [Nitrospirae bacterium]|nr:carbamoyltransferase HypF [Nitrospirota bacterium]